MIQTAIDYAKELHKAGMTHEELSSVKDIFDVVPQVKEELNDPTVSLEKKHLVIQKVFSKNVRNFLQLLCDNNDVNLFEEVYKALTELEKTPEQKESSAVLTYVEAPSDEQLAGIKKFIEKEFHNPDIKLEMVKDPSLKSGFVLKVGSKEYDWSEKARIDQLKSSIAKAVGTGSATASEKGILSILEANIEDFQLEVKDKEIGVVNWVGDGIANVDGIDHAFYGEIVIFDSGVKGMVQDVRRDEVGVILFGSDIEVKPDTIVTIHRRFQSNFQSQALCISNHIIQFLIRTAFLPIITDFLTVRCFLHPRWCEYHPIRMDPSYHFLHTFSGFSRIQYSSVRKNRKIHSAKCLHTIPSLPSIPFVFHFLYCIIFNFI